MTLKANDANAGVLDPLLRWPLLIGGISQVSLAQTESRSFHTAPLTWTKVWTAPALEDGVLLAAMLTGLNGERRVSPPPLESRPPLSPLFPF